MGVRFDASSRSELLEGLFRDRAPRRLTVKLEGSAASIEPTVVLTTFDGRLLDVTAGRRSGVDALTVLALADRGEIESTPIPRPSRESARFPDGIGLYRQAAANASEILTAIAMLGGLSATPAADLDRLVDQIGQIPDAANVVLRLVDNQTTVAGVFGRAPLDLRLTARILQRLTFSEIVVPPATVVPEPIEEPDNRVVAPAPDEMEGESVNADVQHWLEHEEAPERLQSQNAFTSAFTRQTPERMMTPRPGTRAPLPERTPDVLSRVRQTLPPDAEDEFFREAGVGKTNVITWVVLVLVGAVIGIVVGLLLRGEEPVETPDAGQLAMIFPDAMTSTTSTVSTSSVALLLGPDGRPPIAGPDAPEDVKRAERLLNAGRYQEARELLDQLRLTRAQDPTVWILSGQVEVDVGRLAEADTLADKALELDPKSYRGWVLKGSVLQFRGRFTLAEGAYQKALALDPNHPMTAEIQSVLEQLGKNINK